MNEIEQSNLQSNEKILGIELKHPVNHPYLRAQGFPNLSRWPANVVETVRAIVEEKPNQKIEVGKCPNLKLLQDISMEFFGINPTMMCLNAGSFCGTDDYLRPLKSQPVGRSCYCVRLFMALEEVETFGSDVSDQSDPKNDAKKVRYARKKIADTILGVKKDQPPLPKKCEICPAFKRGYRR
ncbi:MAG: hypothetical protein WCO23_02075 [bacterium]